MNISQRTCPRRIDCREIHPNIDNDFLVVDLDSTVSIESSHLRTERTTQTLIQNGLVFYRTVSLDYFSWHQAKRIISRCVIYLNPSLLECVFHPVYKFPWMHFNAMKHASNPQELTNTIYYKPVVECGNQIWQPTLCEIPGKWVGHGGLLPRVYVGSLYDFHSEHRANPTMLWNV